MRTITKLYSFPVKACASVSLDRMDIEEWETRYDRRLMVVDPAGEFVTQRNQPRLALVARSGRTHDSAPRAGDGLCDACAITAGTTSDDEMFILNGATIVAVN